MKALLTNRNFWIVIFAGLIVRLFALTIDMVHPTDYGLFWHWARQLYLYGPSEYYGMAAHSDYMPGYLYVLWLKGFVESLFNLSHGSFAHRLVFMLPSILADVAAAGLIFAWAFESGRTKNIELRAKRSSENRALVLGLFYALNPAVIIISAVWGQVEAVYVLILLVSIYMLTKQRFLAAFVLYTVGILVKPQSIVFGPLYLFFLFDFLRTRSFSMKAFAEIARNGAICIAVLVVLSLPFGLTNVANQFIDTIGQRPFATVNAYNVWAALGLNWYPVAAPIYDDYGVLLNPEETVDVLAHLRFFSPPPMVIRVVGYGLGVGGAALAGIWILVKTKNYFFSSAFIITAFFMLSERMHERYGFAVMLLLLAACAVRQIKEDEGRKRKKKEEDVFRWKVPLVYAGFSLAFFINYYTVLRNTIDEVFSVRGAAGFAWFAIVPFALLIYLAVKMINEEDKGKSKSK